MSASLLDEIRSLITDLSIIFPNLCLYDFKHNLIDPFDSNIIDIYAYSARSDGRKYNFASRDLGLTCFRENIFIPKWADKKYRISEIFIASVKGNCVKLCIDGKTVTYNEEQAIEKFQTLLE